MLLKQENINILSINKEKKNKKENRNVREKAIFYKELEALCTLFIVVLLWVVSFGWNIDDIRYKIWTLISPKFSISIIMTFFFFVCLRLILKLSTRSIIKYQFSTIFLIVMRIESLYFKLIRLGFSCHLLNSYYSHIPSCPDLFYFPYSIFLHQGAWTFFLT